MVFYLLKFVADRTQAVLVPLKAVDSLPIVPDAITWLLLPLPLRNFRLSKISTAQPMEGVGSTLKIGWWEIHVSAVGLELPAMESLVL